MALEVLEGVKKIGDYNLIVMDELREEFPEKFNESGSMDWEWFEKDIRPHNFVYLRKDKNSLSFTIQNGPIKEVGVNGCQMETLLHAYRAILAKHNEKFPCEENKFTLAHIDKALDFQSKRKKNREARGVEGFNKE